MNHLAASVLLLILTCNASALGQSRLSPEALWWPNADRNSNAKGFLYTPELLAALVAGKPEAAIPTRIAQAIREQTPIVVMWTFQDGPSIRGITRPFHSSISEPNEANAIAPLWEQQDAADLRVVDPHTSFQEVGVMAAFPRSAFEAGRFIVMYAVLPEDGTGRQRRVQVFAAVRGGIVARQ